MIARIWHGRTPAEKSEAYVEYLRKTGVRDQTSVEGNRGDFVFRKIEGDVAHFIVLSLWDSMEAVARFAGPDPGKPVYYPGDRDFLLELHPEIEHYETVVAPESPGVEARVQDEDETS